MVPSFTRLPLASLGFTQVQQRADSTNAQARHVGCSICWCCPASLGLPWLHSTSKTWSECKCSSVAYVVCPTCWCRPSKTWSQCKRSSTSCRVLMLSGSGKEDRETHVERYGSCSLRAKLCVARCVLLRAMLRMVWRVMLSVRLCVVFTRPDFDLACVALERGWRCCSCALVALATSSAGVVRLQTSRRQQPRPLVTHSHCCCSSHCPAEFESTAPRALFVNDTQQCLP